MTADLTGLYEKQRRERRMFGCTAAELVSSMEESVTFEVSGIGMWLMSVLSDCQEEIAHGDYERARQGINCVKYLLSTHAACKPLWPERIASGPHWVGSTAKAPR